MATCRRDGDRLVWAREAEAEVVTVFVWPTVEFLPTLDCPDGRRVDSARWAVDAYRPGYSDVFTPVKKLPLSVVEQYTALQEAVVDLASRDWCSDADRAILWEALRWPYPR